MNQCFNDPISKRINELVGQQSNQPMVQRFSESRNRKNTESMSQGANESLKHRNEIWEPQPPKVLRSHHSFAIFKRNAIGALATVSYTFCQAHLPKVLRT